MFKEESEKSIGQKTSWEKNKKTDRQQVQRHEENTGFFRRMVFKV